MSDDPHSPAQLLRVCSAQCRGAIEHAQLRLPSRSTWCRHILIDFNHWAAGLGVFAAQKNSLDYRLRERPDTSALLLSILKQLTFLFRRLPETVCREATSADVDNEEVLASDNTSTISFHAWSSSDSQSSGVSDTTRHDDHAPPSAGSQLCGDAENLIERLLDIGTMIRNAGMSSRLIKADATYRREAYHRLQRHLELLLHMANRCPPHTDTDTEQERQLTSTSAFDMLTQTPLRAEQVVQIEANLRRRHRFAFARKRAATLARAVDNVGTSEAPIPAPVLTSGHVDVMVTDEVPAPVEHPVSATEAPTIPESKAISTQLTASTVEPALDAWLQHYTVELVPEPVAPALSTRLSTTTIRMKYPKPPRISERQAFTCPCCAQRLPRRIGGCGSNWKKHIARDLYPYACPVLDCQASTTFFVKKKDWKAHLEEKHQVVSHWACPICSDGTRFFDLHTFERHIQKQHSSTVGTQFLSTMMTMSERHDIALPTPCPICNYDPGAPIDHEAYLDHLAECLHSFAMRSLPWNDRKANHTSALNRENLDRVGTWLADVPRDVYLAAMRGSRIQTPGLDFDADEEVEEEEEEEEEELHDHAPIEHYFDESAEEDNDDDDTTVMSTRAISASLPPPESLVESEDSTTAFPRLSTEAVYEGRLRGGLPVTDGSAHSRNSWPWEFPPASRRLPHHNNNTDHTAAAPIATAPTATTGFFSDARMRARARTRTPAAEATSRSNLAPASPSFFTRLRARFGSASFSGSEFEGGW